jgi:mannose-6-phosphate isomerase
MVGARFVERWGPTTAVLVKILSPAGPVPLHGHPDRPWAARHLKSRFGKIEGWIILDAVGDGREPAYFAAGFRAGASREWFRKAIERRDHEGMRAQLYRTEVKPGELYVAYPGVPHCMGPQILSIELQEPTDHMVIAECAPEKDQEATMGLGWDRALEVFDCSPTTAEAAFSRARQRPTVLSESRGNRETRLVNADVLDYWDAIRLEVAGEVDVVDGRFCIGIVTAGEGSLEGDFGSLPLRRGDAFACAAALGHRLRVGRERLQVVRCLGPLV